MALLALAAEPKMTFGDWLKKTRKEKGITQQQLADAAGCKFQYISRLENNADIGKDGQPSKPNVAFVDAWAKLLDVPPNEARRIAGHPQIVTTEEEGQTLVNECYMGASEPSREIMREVMKTIYEIDRKRAAEGEEQASPEKSSEWQAAKWPGAKAASKKGSKSAKSR